MTKKSLREKRIEKRNMLQAKKKKIEARVKIIMTVIKLSILLAIVVGLPLYLYFTQKDFLSQFNSLESVSNFLAQYKTQSIFIYMGIQILQIVISVIPGQMLQFAAAYMYGFGMGLVYSLIGASIGTVITFYLARLLGKDGLYLIFGKAKLRKFIDKLNSKKAYIIIFIIYLIPGFPKDIFNYAAGLSEINMKPFLCLSLLGRTPGIMGSLAIGIMLKYGSYTGLIVLGSIVVILAILAIIFRKHLREWGNSFYKKLSE